MYIFIYIYTHTHTHTHTSTHTQGVVLRTMKGHAKDVTCAAVSFSLKLLATSGADGHILVWNYGLGLLEGLCKGHAQDVTHVEFLEPYPALLSAGMNVYIYE